MRPSTEAFRERLERTVLSPLAQTTRGYYAFVLFLAAVVAWGLYAYIIQLRYGLLATGMRDVVMWGLYLVNFVFFIGISHAGIHAAASQGDQPIGHVSCTHLFNHVLARF